MNTDSTRALGRFIRTRWFVLAVVVFNAAWIVWAAVHTSTALALFAVWVLGLILSRVVVAWVEHHG